MDAEQRNRAIRIRRFGYLDSMICHCVDKYDSLDYPILIADIDFGSSTTRRANTLSLSLETIIENASAGSCISFERLHLEQSANQWRK